jgi:homoserine kinase
MRFGIGVPATSANLGPGFDSLGIALSCHNRFEIVFPGSGFILGCEERYANRDNLFLQSFAAASAALLASMREGPWEIRTLAADPSGVRLME